MEVILLVKKKDMDLVEILCAVVFVQKKSVIVAIPKALFIKIKRVIES